MTQVKWDKEAIGALLDSSDKAVERAILVTYAKQTRSEQDLSYTINHNNVGFSAFDGEFLSNMAKVLISGNKLTKSQLAISRNKMKRYWRQLLSDIESKNTVVKKTKSYVIVEMKK